MANLAAKKPIKKRRRTDKEFFADTLKELSKGVESGLIGNAALREKLNWSPEKYERVKQTLVDEGVVRRGRGHGGTVGVSEAATKKPLSMFVSYSHVDDEIKNELLKHLTPLKRMKLIDVWHDRAIKPGDEWEPEIFKELEKADIILLLVSIDFINSEFCYEKELELAMERHDAGEAVVIPILIRKCLWQFTLFSKLQALPKDALPVASWQSRDEAFVDVAVAIHKIAQEQKTQQ